MFTTVAVLAALIIDHCLGEPRRWHPLVGFGRAAQWIEARWHRDTRGRGVLCVAVLLAAPVLVTGLADAMLRAASGDIPWWIAFDAVVLYLAVGWNSLRVHALAVHRALADGSLQQARREVGRLVSRDNAALDEAGVSRACVESVLENGSDAVIGAIFWYALAGAPGVVLYRLANTLDAMWGYRNVRYARFGWAAARLDDLLNIVPAQLAALGYALAGRTGAALRCWFRQGFGWKSPNAGVVMAAGAGALGVQLGGAARYHGVVQARPPLGEGRAPDGADILRALALVRNALIAWLTCLALGGFIVERYLS